MSRLNSQHDLAGQSSLLNDAGIFYFLAHCLSA